MMWTLCSVPWGHLSMKTEVSFNKLFKHFKGALQGKKIAVIITV